MAIKDYSTDPDLNVQISGINIAEGCPPSGINNAIRQLMADVKVERDETLEAQTAKDAAQDAAIAEAQSSADAAGDSAAVSFEVDGLDLVITYGNGTTERVKLPTGKGVGDLWWGHDPKSVPANVQLYSGQLLSRSAYEAHSALVLGGKRTVVSESEWQSYASAHDGMCPYYSSGDGSTTYRMPCIKGVHPKFVAALAEAGKYVEAGAPNITGEINHFYTGSGINYSGALNFTSYEGSTGATNGTTINKWRVLTFNASRSNSIYGNSDTVQPPAVNVILGEYVVGTVAVVGEADAESLLAGQTLLDAKVGALEGGVGRAKAYITATWHSGVNWYRKWSDGFIEQGGWVNSTSATMTVTFHTPFSKEDYTITVTDSYSGYTNDSSAVVAGSPTTTSFKVGVAAGNLGVDFSWSACGY
jgi:hypothetical protein